MNKYNAKELVKYLSSPQDILIGCVSYESRCLSIPLALKDIKIKYPIFFLVNEFANFSKNNKDQLNLIFGETLKTICYSNKEHIDFVDQLVDLLINVEKLEGRKLNITVDITTFTRESLVILIGVLFSLKDKIDTLHLAYSPPSQISHEWLSRGFTGLRSILGYPGERSSLKPLHMVVMTGFELERAKNIINEYEPFLISIGTPCVEKSINPEFHERNEKFVNDLIEYYGTNVETFKFSLIEPTKVICELENHIGKFKNEYNTVIAPLNNKISTVGAALYAIKHTDVQLCYLPAEEYNTENYSVPSDFFYAGKINLNSIQN